MADAIEIFTSSASERIEVVTSGAQGPKGDAGVATFDQDLNTTDAVAFASVNAPLYDAALSQPGAGVDDAVFSIYAADGTAKLDANGMTGLRVLALPDESGTLALVANTATAAQGALADTAVQPNTGPSFTGIDVLADTPAVSVESSSSGKATAIKEDRLEFSATGNNYVHTLQRGTISADATFTLPTSTGTLALTSQIPSTFAASAITSGTLNTARLGSGTASSGTWLRGDSTWQALPAAGTKTYYRATAMDNQPPASAFATLDTRNSIAVLDFDDASTESAVFVGIIPEGAVVSSGLIVVLKWMATTATSGDVRWSVDFERSTTDLDSDSFDTATAATATTSGTSGIPTSTSITCTTIDSIVAGDLFRVRVQRVGGNAADTMSGDAELVAVEIRSAA